MIEIRKLKDVKKLVEWRKEVIKTVFGIEPDEALLKENDRYYRLHIADGTHIAFVAYQGFHELGCGALCISQELPSPDNPGGLCGYIMNIYVKEQFRKRGIAHGIVHRIIEEAKLHNCGKIYLETTEIAKKLYKSLGFKEMNGMMKYDG